MPAELVRVENVDRSHVVALAQRITRVRAVARLPFVAHTAVLRLRARIKGEITARPREFSIAGTDARREREAA